MRDSDEGFSLIELLIVVTQGGHKRNSPEQFGDGVRIRFTHRG